MTNETKTPEGQKCHCGKDGHALNSINCPVHGTTPSTEQIISCDRCGQAYCTYDDESKTITFSADVSFNCKCGHVSVGGIEVTDGGNLTPSTDSWEERFEKMTPETIPSQLDTLYGGDEGEGYDEWLKTHSSEHLYEDSVYGEPMCDLSKDKVKEFIRSEIPAAEEGAYFRGREEEQRIRKIEVPHEITAAKLEERKRLRELLPNRYDLIGHPALIRENIGTNAYREGFNKCLDEVLNLLGGEDE